MQMKLIFQVIRVKVLIGVILATTSMLFAQPKAPASVNAAAEGIVFRSGSWEEVVAEAKKSGKFIFVDAYAAWCRPCKLLQSTTFREKNASAYFNKNFVNYAADMEKGSGVQLSEQWDVEGYPALLFFDPEGKIIMRHTGYVDGKALIRIGRQALSKR